MVVAMLYKFKTEQGGLKQKSFKKTLDIQKIEEITLELMKINGYMF